MNWGFFSWHFSRDAEGERIAAREKKRKEKEKKEKEGKREKGKRKKEEEGAGRKLIFKAWIFHFFSIFKSAVLNMLSVAKKVDVEAQAVHKIKKETWIAFKSFEKGQAEHKEVEQA
ncbi:hypothetical protein Adt_23578 [Abeliophyllum distichum]|uniref:Uncharacterized protein n=1 Tax=Abeliophyllum distichum TaxID=126358 RepID=A0ABD1SCC5_9LAMI